MIWGITTEMDHPKKIKIKDFELFQKYWFFHENFSKFRKKSDFSKVLWWYNGSHMVIQRDSYSDTIGISESFWKIRFFRNFEILKYFHEKINIFEKVQTSFSYFFCGWSISVVIPQITPLYTSDLTSRDCSYSNSIYGNEF